MDKKLFLTTQCTVSIAEFIRFSSCIKINHKGLSLPFFSNMSINFVNQLFDKIGQMQLRKKLKENMTCPKIRNFSDFVLQMFHQNSGVSQLFQMITEILKNYFLWLPYCKEKPNLLCS